MTADAARGEDEPTPKDDEALIQRGLAWSTAATALTRAGNFLVGIAVARIVAPEQFGVMAAALVVHGVIQSANDLGVTMWIMRTPTTDPRQLPTLNVIAVGFATFATLAMAGTAPWIAKALGAPDATSAIRILSLTVLIGGFSAVPTALLFRDLRQDRRFIADVGTFISASVTVIWFVSSGMGADGIAWSRVIGLAVGTAMYMIFARYFMRIGFQTDIAAMILRFSIPLVAANMITLAIANVDYVVVGRALGTVSLGYYALAMNVAGWPSTIIMSVLQTIVVPATGRFRSNPGLLRTQLVRGLGFLFFVVLPVSAMLVVLAAPLVLFLYGQEWTPATGVVAILGLAGIWRISITVLSDVITAMGATGTLFLVKIGWFILVIPLLVVGVSVAGLEGVAGVQTLVMAFIVTPALLLVLRALGALDLRALVKTLTPLVVAVIPAALVAMVVGDAIAVPWLAVIAGGLAGALAYAVMIGLEFLIFRRTQGGWWQAYVSRAPASW